MNKCRGLSGEKGFSTVRSGGLAVKSFAVLKELPLVLSVKAPSESGLLHFSHSQQVCRVKSGAAV